MAGIWIYSENTAVAKELVGLARTIAGGREVNAVAASAEAAAELAAIGVKRSVALVNASDWKGNIATPLGEFLAAEGAEVTLIGGTAAGKAIAGQVAVSLDAGLVTDATHVGEIGTTVTTERIVYGGLAVATEESVIPAVITIPAHSHDAPADGEAGVVETKECAASSGVSVQAVEPVKHEGVDLNQADKVVGIGRGVDDKGDLALIDELAGTFGAEVGCTRPIAENTDWMPVERYIGISGKQIKGSLYMAVGVSGQIQHVSGIRDAKVIVAINKDEGAPIFAAADYGIVGDYKAVVPALISAIKAAK